MLLKTAFREIKTSLGRYLAILAIIALGVGFFAGLRVTRTAMISTANHYLKDLAMFDDRILSTLGWTEEDVARYLVELKILGNTDEFLSLCKSGESYSGYYFIEEMMKTDTVSQRRYALEGYLSPNTYEIYTSSSADTIIKRLLTQMEATYLTGYDERAQELGMTMDEVITLASMIEKEAKKSDFAKVSAVFHNRLKADMTLGSDVTIKYATGSEKMVLGDSELSVNSAYNTYTRKGLPVGPICNPSMDAIVAALYPDEQYVAQKYLYFCSTDPASGELHFSKTLEEHNAAVAMYRPLWEEYDRSRGLN